MNGEARGNLVDVIARTYTLKQLDALVHRALGQPLEYYAIAPDLQTVVDKLIAELEQRPADLATLLFKLREWVPPPPLRAAIDRYYGIASTEMPYEALVVLDEPFVNRQLLRGKLNDLFHQPNRRVLVVRGPRAAGKSHSRWLIEHVSRSEGVETVYLQLKDNTLEDIVSQLINELNLPPKEFRDRLAQFATVTKGFVSALRGSSRAMPPGQRWCLIFDSHDYDSVPKESRDFVDALMGDVANVQMPPIWMVVLGHRPSQTVQPSARVIADEVVPMTSPEVERFLSDLAGRWGRTFGEGTTVADVARELFQGLVPPLDHDGMRTLHDRLCTKVADLTGRG
jgi:hypothetical protein